MKKINLLWPGIILALFLASCSGGKKEKDASAVNPTIETIMNRKSVRDYTSREISQEDMEIMLKAGMAAPSSKDRRPWQFIVISDKAMLENLAAQLPNASMLKAANKAIVVCGDSIISDNNWFVDCAAVTENILLAAESMGIGAVWTAVYPYGDRTAIINQALLLPEYIKPFAVIPMGYPLGRNMPKDKFDKSRIHYHKW